MIFLINQSNQIRTFFVQKSHHTNFLHDSWVGYPPSPRPSPFNLHPVLYILNTFMHCQIVMRIQKHRQTDDTSGKWPTRFLCVFSNCVWRGCVISCMFISYVSSNPLPKKKHSHIGCFSPLWVCKCAFKLLAWEEPWSYWLHLYDFSPVWVFKCVLKSPAQKEA